MSNTVNRCSIMVHVRDHSISSYGAPFYLESVKDLLKQYGVIEPVWDGFTHEAYLSEGCGLTRMFNFNCFEPSFEVKQKIKRCMGATVL